MGSLPGTGSVHNGMVTPVRVEIPAYSEWEYHYTMDAGAKGKTPPIRYFVVASSTDDPNKRIEIRAELRYRKYAK